MSVLEGEDFDCIIAEQTQQRLDTDVCKTLIQDMLDKGYITADRARACYKDITFDVVSTKRRDASKKPKWVAPTIGDNQTPESIMDMLGHSREEENNHKKTTGYLKEALKARAAGKALPTEEEIKEFFPEGFTLY